jgi:hypothetical protein
LAGIWAGIIGFNATHTGAAIAWNRVSIIAGFARFNDSVPANRPYRAGTPVTATYTASIAHLETGPAGGTCTHITSNAYRSASRFRRATAAQKDECRHEQQRSDGTVHEDSSFEKGLNRNLAKLKRSCPFAPSQTKICV